MEEACVRNREVSYSRLRASLHQYRVINMSKQTIRIRLKSFDHKLIDQSAGEIVETAREQVLSKSPIPCLLEDALRF